MSASRLSGAARTCCDLLEMRPLGCAPSLSGELRDPEGQPTSADESDGPAVAASSGESLVVRNEISQEPPSFHPPELKADVELLGCRGFGLADGLGHLDSIHPLGIVQVGSIKVREEVLAVRSSSCSPPPRTEGIASHPSMVRRACQMTVLDPPEPGIGTIVPSVMSSRSCGSSVSIDRLSPPFAGLATSPFTAAPTSRSRYPVAFAEWPFPPSHGPRLITKARCHLRAVFLPRQLSSRARHSTGAQCRERC